VNTAAVIYSGCKLLLEKHNNPVKKTNFVSNHKLFFGKFKLHLKEHDESTRSEKMAVA